MTTPRMAPGPVPRATFDSRFSEPGGEAPPWEDVRTLFAEAELYWLTTVRADGRPHVTPLVGVWHDGAFVFCTGREEQKAQNLGVNAQVAVTTGSATWQAGQDVVVEGTAERLTGRAALRAAADTYEAKYGEAWAMECDDEVFDPSGTAAHVFAVRPAKVLSFTKAPHGQAAYRFD